MKEEAESSFFEFWKKAVVQLNENNRFTMEDQKYWARVFFDEQINNGKFPQGGGRYTHIIIDEFQDINPLDLELLKSASLYHGRGKHVSLTIVGDDDQAIFGWRGTTPEFILHPDEYFGVKFETAVLDTNNRSPKKIVEISQKLISYNKDRVPKEMKSGAKGNAYVALLSRKDTLSTFETVLNQVHKLIDSGKCRNVALIGRKQVSLFPYQILLSAEKERYNVDADLDIFDGDAMQALQRIIQIVYRAKQNDNDDDESGAGYEQNQEIKIHLMTATRSKGHEYDAVIILDVDDDEWPNRLTDNIEEERRLFYVAMTRARKYLYFAVSGGKLESRFLLEARVI